MKALELGLKAAALKVPVANREFYRQNEPQYGKSVFRVSGHANSVGIYSYIYRNN